MINSGPYNISRIGANVATVSPALFQAVGDNIANDTAKINALIQHAKNNNLAVVWDGKRYKCDGNLVDFHSVMHIGTGEINRNGAIWYITPTGEQVNVINAAPNGSASNDGLSPASPVSIRYALDLLKVYGYKASDGQWRIQLSAGTYTENGVRLDNIPQFTKAVQVWGANVSLTETPISVWDGSGSSNVFAIRQDGTVAAVANWEFKNIKFINWMVGSGNSGAILIWAQGRVVCENIHADNIRVGVWLRHCISRITHGKIENFDTFGVAIQNGSSGNLGDLSGGGVLLQGRVGGSALGVQVGRNSVAYIQGCAIDHTNTHISASRIGRIRTQANTFGANYNVACVYVDTGSVWTPDNSSATPDIYPTLTELKPAYRAESGASHAIIDRLGRKSLHLTSDNQIITFSSSARTLISQDNPTFVPFRLPSYFLFSPSFRLDIEIGISLASNAGGTFEFSGASDLAAGSFGQLVIPAQVTGSAGIIRISVVQSPNASTARFSASYLAGGVIKEMVQTPSLNNAAFRASAESIINFRMYWTGLNSNNVQIFNMRTYVEL